MNNLVLRAFLAEAASRIRDIQEALVKLSPEGEGRDLLELRVEDAAALANNIEEALK